MYTVGIIGCFSESEFATNLISALKVADIEVISASGDFRTELPSAEVLDKIGDVSTDLVIVLFSGKYIAELRSEKRLENELLFRLLQQAFERIIPLTYEDDLALPNIYSTLQLFDVRKFGLAALVGTIQRRLALHQPTSPRLTPHPRIHEALVESFPGKEVERFSGPVVMRDEGIGYELFRIKDQDFGDLFVVHTYEPIVIRNTADHLLRTYGGIVAQQLYLIANRDRSTPYSEVRLDHLQKAFSAKRSWYVDTFIVERLGLDPEAVHIDIPAPKAYFVEPRVRENADGREALALPFLHQWHAAGSPILVVRGPGGIGKTQLLRKFARDIAETENVTVVYLDSVTILDYTRNKTIPLNDVSLSTLSQITASIYDLGPISKERFETLLTSDRFIVILDGLDEIIPRLPTGYKITDFFDSVRDVLGDLAGGRLLISCRNSFWGIGDQSIPIQLIDLEAFNEAQVSRYFENRFSGEPAARERCGRVISEMRRYFKGDIYPFMLDLTCRMAEVPNYKIADKSIEERAYFDDGQLLDEVLWHVCRREAAKFGNEGLRLEEHPLNVPLQAAFFIELALHMDQLPGSILSESARKHLEQSLKRGVSDAVFTAFRSHPLLDPNADSGTIQFSYDFVQEYFLALAVKQGLHLERNISDKGFFLTGLCRLESNFLRTVARKVGPLSDEVTLGISELIDTFKPRENWQPELWNRSVGGAVNIGLQCLLLDGRWDIGAATQYLKDLFAAKTKDATLVDLVLLAPNSDRRITFSFETLTVRSAAIIDYDAFLRCKFDRQTRFMNSVIFGGKFSEGGKTSASLANFDDSCAIDERIRSVVRSRDTKTAASEQNSEKNVRAFLRAFRSHGTFHRPRNPETISGSFGISAGVSFQRLLKIGIDCGLIVTNVGQGGAFVGINPKHTQEVEDFVEQGVQGSHVRAAIAATLII